MNNNSDDVSALFIGCLYSENKKEQYLKNSKRGFQFAAQLLQESFLSGLICNNVFLEVITFPSLSFFPFGYKKPIVSGGDFFFSGEKIGKTIGRLNIPFVDLGQNYTKYIDSWIKEAKGKKIVFVYSANLRMMSAATWIKENHPEVHICYIIPDLPIYMGENRYYKLLGLDKKKINIVNENIGKFDSYVVLTEKIAEALDLSTKKHIVIEGMYNPNSDTFDVGRKERRIFLYAGGLHKRYGVIDLVEAFSKLTSKNTELWICGSGDAEGAIKEYAQKDSRIKYFGVVSHDEVIKKQHEASFLVNPRHSSENFINYSFPSKTIEYMASGTPIIMCRLGCLPKDYLKYLLFFNDETIDGMTKTMSDALNLSNEDIDALGKNARNFIINNKTPKVQVKKILEMIIKNY